MEKTISFFADFYDAVKFLDDAAFGALMRAAVEYQLTGKEYDGDNPMVMMGFNFAKSSTDRKKEYSRKKSENANARWQKQADANTINERSEESSGMQSDANGCKMMQTDAEQMQSDAPYPYPNPYPNPNNTLTYAPASDNAIKTFGSFGWVKLTDEEYTAIVNDLGKAEAERCIAYVDESAQVTGNKNEWRDWNLVIRKCSRDGWGKTGKPRYTGNVQTVNRTGRRDLDEDEKRAVIGMMAECEGA